MSGPLELYRTTVNLRGLGAGAEIEIDPTDDAWAGDIRSGRIVPASTPQHQVRPRTSPIAPWGLEADDD